MRLLYLPAFLMILQSTLTGCRINSAQLNITWKDPVSLPDEGGVPNIGLAGPFAGILDNLLLIGGGANFPEALPWEGGRKYYQQQLHLYRLTEEGGCDYWKSKMVPELRSYGCSYSTPKGIVLAGGEGADGPDASVWLIRNSATGIEVESLPALPLPLTNAAGTSINNQLFIAGGESLTGMNKRFLRLSLDTPAKGWQELPALPYPVSHAVLQNRIVNGEEELVLAGGRSRNGSDTSELYNKTWIYSVALKRWEQAGTLPYPVAAAQAVTLADESILLIGGDDGTRFTQVEKMLGAIHQETDSILKTDLIGKKNELQRTHPGFRKEMLLLKAGESEWKLVGKLPFDPPVTTQLLRWQNQLVLPSGEIRAGVRSPFIRIGELDRK